ncbi:hypothetical protein NFI96_003327 [Prochilodus magdalenae]|nr:hypothetical protein NFI96_003327 [Prochilodus magdalenae]
MSKRNKLIHGILASMEMSISDLDYIKDHLEESRTGGYTRVDELKDLPSTGTQMASSAQRARCQNGAPVFVRMFPVRP